MNTTLHLFTLGRIPVFAQGWFLALLAMSFMGAGSYVDGALWVVCVTFSILVHELGHAVVALAFGLQPAIVLHGWGGLCFHQPARRDRDDALIIAAGPGVQLVLGGIVVATSVVLGVVDPGFVAARPLLQVALVYLTWINIVWACVNLVPLYPLDGGQLFRLVAYKLLSERTAERVVHGTGLALGVLLAIVAVQVGMGFGALLAGLLAFENLDVLRGRKSPPVARRRNSHADLLLKDARTALAEGRPTEALRLAHQIRAERNLPDDVVLAAWELLVVGSLAAGAAEDAIRYSRYAPDTAAVRTAKAEAESALRSAGAG